MALERELGLAPASNHVVPTAGDDGVEVVFRVRVRDRDASHGVYIVGADAQLGNLVPNRVALFDDRTHGDQRAGDGVWSYTARLPAGATAFYVYTVSGEDGVWSGLDVPYVRRLDVDAGLGGQVHGPIDTWGRIYMQADGWHTNALGYRLLADRVADAAAAWLAPPP